MTDLDLARRAVACKGWRWDLPGILWVLDGVKPFRAVDICDGGDALQEHGWLPDFADPATRGCLLQLVREAWGCPTIFVRFGCGWFIDGDDRLWGAERYPTEADALVAALQAAPERK